MPQKTVQGALAVDRKLDATIVLAFVEVAFIVAPKTRHCFIDAMAECPQQVKN